MKKSNLYFLITGFFVIAFLIYGASLRYEFVRWDDGLLIYENPAIREINARSLFWIFSNYDPELYIPLTFLSYQINYLIGGIHPFVYNLTNLILHIINALLVVLCISLLSKKRTIGIFCGLLFLVHPLNTEAVVWASARKDVLSGMFFLLSLCTYIKFRHTQDRRMYRVSIAAYFLGLLSKASILMLPFILLLIDYSENRKLTKSAVLEKIPYFAFSVLFGVIALIGKTEVIKAITPLQTVLMAFRSTAFVLQKIVWPTHLSVLYPVQHITLFSPEFLISIVLCLLLLGSIFVLKKNKICVFCLLFFGIMLVPSFSNFGIGDEFFVSSDRYAYLASIGIVYLFVFYLYIVANTFFSNKHIADVSTSVFFSSVCLIFSIMAYQQSHVWKNSESLFLNIIQYYPDQSIRPYNNLGNIYRRAGDNEKAISYFNMALAVTPHPWIYGNLGSLYRSQNRIKDALDQYQKALELDTNNPEAYFGLGLVYAQAGDTVQALEHYRGAIDRDPTYAEAYSNMGAIYAAAGDYSHAIELYKQAININSLFLEAYYNLGIALTKNTQEEQAISVYENVIRLESKFLSARINLGILYYNAGRFDESIKQFRTVLKFDPKNASAISALRQMGEI